jgi:ornithine cyclodeaminase/alanine dehydrogenase
VDSIATALKKSGDVLLAIAEGAIGESDVQKELGDVITGKAPGRSSADEITLFNSVGIALQDLAIGSLLVQRARANGIGPELDMSN